MPLDLPLRERRDPLEEGDGSRDGRLPSSDRTAEEDRLGANVRRKVQDLLSKAADTRTLAGEELLDELGDPVATRKRGASDDHDVGPLCPRRTPRIFWVLHRLVRSSRPHDRGQ